MKIRRSIVHEIKDRYVVCNYILTILVMFKHTMDIPNPMKYNRNNEFLFRCLNKVKKAEYGFNVSDYKVLRESYANLVLLIDKEYVFKFPKDSENSKRPMNRKLNFILANLVDIGGVNTEIGDGTWFWKVSEAPSGRPLGRYRIRVTSINK